MWPLCEDYVYEKYDVKAVDARTAANRWQHALGTYPSSPTFITQNSSLLVLDRGRKPGWCFELPSGDEIGVSRCGDAVSTSTEPNELPDVYYHPRLALESGPFEVKLAAQRSVEVEVAPTGYWRLPAAVVVLVGDGLTTSLGELIAFRPSTGERRWSRRSDEPGRVTVSRIGGGLAALLPGGRILFIDATGEIALEVVHGIKQSHPSLWANSRFIDMGDITLLALYGELIALDRPTFAFLWSVPRNDDQVQPIRWNDLVIYGIPQEMAPAPHICAD